MTWNAKTDARQNDPGEKMSMDDKKGSKQKKSVQDSNVNVNGNQLLSFARDFANVTVTTYFVAYLRSVISCSIFHGIV